MKPVCSVVTLMDPDYSTRRRIEAAEALLGFEAPADAVMRAREYLQSVFENREEKIDDRMEAAQITRKLEAKKIAPQTVHISRREETDRKEAWRNYDTGVVMNDISRRGVLTLEIK
jgi:hypothetical protein